MEGDTRFGCEVNKKILEEFCKTFNHAGQKNGDTIKAYIEKAMKQRTEEHKNKK